MERLNRMGFIYAGRGLMSDVLKVGFTTARDPGAYIRCRYAGLLKINNPIAVTDAPNAERLVQLHSEISVMNRSGPGSSFCIVPRLTRYSRYSRGPRS
jgi:hypothetical protein